MIKALLQPYIFRQMSLALVLFDQFACYEFIKIKGVLRTAFDWDQKQPNYTGLPVEK